MDPGGRDVQKRGLLTWLLLLFYIPNFPVHPTRLYKSKLLIERRQVITRKWVGVIPLYYSTL
jgi:hypothetical protein